MFSLFFKKKKKNLFHVLKLKSYVQGRVEMNCKNGPNSQDWTWPYSTGGLVNLIGPN